MKKEKIWLLSLYKVNILCILLCEEVSFSEARYQENKRLPQIHTGKIIRDI